MAICLSLLKKKKVHAEASEQKKVHPAASQECEAHFLAMAAQPGTKLSQVYPDPIKLRRVLLRRAIVDEPESIHLPRRHDFKPKPTRFALEALSIPPPAPPEPRTPTPPEPRRRRSRKDRQNVNEWSKRMEIC